MINKEAVIQRLIDLKLVTDRNDGEHWILNEKLAGFDKTADQLIKDKRIDAVFDYIEHIADGGYA